MHDSGDEEHPELQELAVVRLHNGELAEDIVDVDQRDGDERIVHSHPLPASADEAAPVPGAPGTLPRHARHD